MTRTNAVALVVFVVCMVCLLSLSIRPGDTRPVVVFRGEVLVLTFVAGACAGWVIRNLTP